jgi:hypothetical protein
VPGFVQIFMCVLACAMVGFPALMASLGCFWLLSDRSEGRLKGGLPWCS